MLKCLSVTFAFLVLLQSSNISVSDLLQLDELIEHAQFHNEAHGDNFFVFLSKHYGELKAAHHKEHKHEQSDHEQLPFSHNQCMHNITVLALITTDSKTDLKLIALTELKESNFFYCAPSSSAHTKGLLQPPRTT